MELNATPQNFLARAAEAELEAGRVKDPLAKASWLRIADSYRDLATFPASRALPGS
jgi:hypothetical protein